MINGPAADNIQQIFTKVAAGYDRANDAMTFGMARHWRNRLVQLAEVQGNDAVLDCATGTGDVAFAFAKKIAGQGRVVGLDFCEPMLARAKQKSQIGNIEFIRGDVLQLPFADHTFAAATIAYGIRNVADPILALNEMARVVRPGGRVLVLETGLTSGPMAPFLNFYLQRMVPLIGGWITGARDAYDYLNRSSRAFPSGAAFCQWMNQTGRFSQVRCETLLGGASYIYVGQVN